jgi:hypothetical protein
LLLTEGGRNEISHVFVSSVLAACGVCNAVEVLKQEPALGTASPGEKFLVDDGTCGRGKIEELTIGDWNYAMGASGADLRNRRCIARK